MLALEVVSLTCSCELLSQRGWVLGWKVAYL